MNISRIMLALLLIVGAGGALAGGTSAFFSDTETSTGNTFTAGSFDLKIDNDSYYNGNRCVNIGTSLPDWRWQGDSAYPVPGTPCATSWTLSDLGNGLLFFDFDDIKPDDEGEDTISIHVQNNAWACLDLSLTSNDDNTSTEPELADGDGVGTDDAWDGELAQNLQMLWWADDGDNVYEVGETQITNGAQTIDAMFGQDHLFSVTLADSLKNIWTPNDVTPDPIPAEQTVYIAKAWCMGTLTPAALAQDGNGTDGPLAPNRVGTGFTCDGTLLDNKTQTDGVTMDVAFRAEQHRNNPNFKCDPTQQRQAKITVTKIVNNNDGGNNTVGSFQLFLDGLVDVNLTSGVQIDVNPGTYTVAELGASGYEASFSGQCDVDGVITLAEGDVKTCTITNDDIRPNVTLIKNVVGGTAVVTDFKMRVNGFLVPSGGSRSVNSNTNVAITEDAFAGYTPTALTGTGCPANLGDVFQLNEGVAITCTITNTAN